MCVCVCVCVCVWGEGGRGGGGGLQCKPVQHEVQCGRRGGIVALLGITLFLCLLQGCEFLIYSRLRHVAGGVSKIQCQQQTVWRGV